MRSVLDKVATSACGWREKAEREAVPEVRRIRDQSKGLLCSIGSCNAPNIASLIDEAVDPNALGPPQDLNLVQRVTRMKLLKLGDERCVKRCCGLQHTSSRGRPFRLRVNETLLHGLVCDLFNKSASVSSPPTSKTK